MKDSEKWKDIKTSKLYTCGSKRTKTFETTHNQSLDAHIEVDLNEDEPIAVPIPILSHGKRQSKTKCKWIASSSSDVDKTTTKVDNLKTTSKQYLSIAKEKEKTR